MNQEEGERKEKDIVVLFISIDRELRDTVLKIAIYENSSVRNLAVKAIEEFVEKKKREYSSLDFPLSVEWIEERLAVESLNPEIRELLERLNKEFKEGSIDEKVATHFEAKNDPVDYPKILECNDSTFKAEIFNGAFKLTKIEEKAEDLLFPISISFRGESLIVYKNGLVILYNEKGAVFAISCNNGPF